jgi:hypothetical protein
MASNTNRPIKASSAERAARAAILRNTQAMAAGNSTRLKAVSKGAFGARGLRAGGTSLDQYNAGRYANIYGPAAPAGIPGGGGTTTSNRVNTTTRAKPKPKPLTKEEIAKRQAAARKKQQSVFDKSTGSGGSYNNTGKYKPL